MQKGHWYAGQVTEFSAPRAILKCPDLVGQPPQVPATDTGYGGLNIRGCHD